MAPDLNGSYTGREALIKLLSGTGLRFVTHKHTVEILLAADQKSPVRGKERANVQHNSGLATGGSIPEYGDPPQSNRITGRPASISALQEVIVTAQLYRQPLFNVPISVDVFTDKTLADLRISSLNALQYGVPGLYIESGAGFSRLTIDGIGNGLGSGALVGEYIDDADVTGDGNTGATGVSTGDVSLTDVSRVEVLHGPQGTLYGDGAMGGVVRIITNKPNLYSPEFSSDVAALFSQYGATSQHIQTILNVPLVSGTLGLRFAGAFEHDGG
jgi:outer membrane receptor protein involved in Fe transport